MSTQDDNISHLNPVARATYAPGDTVVLLSGGPLMTISEVRGDRAQCIWFVADETLCTGEIPLVCVEPAGALDFMGDGEGHKDHIEVEEPADKKKKKKKKHSED